MPQHEPLEVSVEDVTCSRCGNEFMATVTRIEGRAIRPNICPACGELEDAPAGTAPGSQRMASLEKIGVNVRRHGESTFDSFLAAGESAALTAAREFVAQVREAGRWAPVRGLMLCGTTGVGKTHLAVAIIQGAIQLGVPSDRILFDRASRLITEIQDTYGTGGTAKVLEKRERAILWVLDDLGTEKATADTLRILHDLIDAREGHPNVITSNLTPPELGQRFHDVDGWARIASRLGARNYRIVRVAGRDHRFQAPAA